MTLRRHDVAEPQLRILLQRKYQPSRTHFALGKLAEARGAPRRSRRALPRRAQRWNRVHSRHRTGSSRLKR